MIHMLSRFDLKQNVRIEQFREAYEAFAAHMQARGMVEASGKIGRRVAKRG